MREEQVKQYSREQIRPGLMFFSKYKHIAYVPSILGANVSFMNCTGTPCEIDFEITEFKEMGVWSEKKKIIKLGSNTGYYTTVHVPVYLI